MSKGIDRRPESRQRGFALLVLLSLLVLGASAVFLTAQNGDIGARAVADERRVATALTEALDALTMHNIDDDKLPGTLPCPDAHPPDDPQAGTASLLTGDDCPNYTGRLPWRTLDTNRDGGRLWYVLDPAFRDDGEFRDTEDGEAPVNPELVGALSLDGRSGYAALVIDPGPPLEGQTDRRQSEESLEDFLEAAENTDGDMAFVNCSGGDACNDRVVGLTTDELFSAAQRRALAIVAQAISDFADDHGYWPYAAEFDSNGVCEDDGELETTGLLAIEEGDCGDNSTLTRCDFSPQTDCDPEDIEEADRNWFTSNQWHDVIYYDVDSACTEGGGGCAAAALELDERTGLAVILGAAGRPISDLGQTRPGSAATDYLDHPKNVDGDKHYRDFPPGPTDNDAFRGVPDD